MPKYYGKVQNARLRFTRPDLIGKLAKKHEGQWFEFDMKFPAEQKAPKSPEQLGFYWGLLLPEITDELNRQGHTRTVSFRNFTREVAYDKPSVHELITQLCGQIGDDGKDTRLSESGKHLATKFIDNVLHFAVVDLGMNEEKLLAWKDKNNGSI
jgi:hypothetical protein